MKVFNTHFMAMSTMYMVRVLLVPLKWIALSFFWFIWLAIAFVFYRKALRQTWEEYTFNLERVADVDFYNYDSLKFRKAPVLDNGSSDHVAADVLGPIE